MLNYKFVKSLLVGQTTNDSHSKKTSCEIEFLESKKTDYLRKNLRNLEFINYLEISLKETHLTKMPLSFLQELQTIKINTQINILNLTNNKNH